jgi:hypothetical protein
MLTVRAPCVCVPRILRGATAELKIRWIGPPVTVRDRDDRNLPSDTGSSQEASQAGQPVIPRRKAQAHCRPHPVPGTNL